MESILDIHASKIEILKVSNTKREKETSTVSLSNLLQKPDRMVLHLT
jgi:hypothetical protein